MRRSKWLVAGAVIAALSAPAYAAPGDASPNAKTANKRKATKHNKNKAATKKKPAAAPGQQVTVLTFCAVWSHPCKQHLRNLDQLAAAVAKKHPNVSFEVVLYENERVAADRLMRNAGADHLVLVWNERVALQQQLDPQVIPTTYVLDQAGVVQGEIEGMLDAKAAKLRKLVEAQARRPAPPRDPKVVAKELFKKGTEYYKNGDYARAASTFEAAYKAVPLPELLYNVARAHDQAGHTKRALAAYRRLPKGANAWIANQAKARIAALEKKLRGK